MGQNPAALVSTKWLLRMLILTFIRPGHEPSLNQVSLHVCVCVCVLLVLL